jgi:hypothetical protein
MASDFEALVSKAREVRSVLLLAGQGAEFEAKRFASTSELTEKVVVFRELVIQGKFTVGPRIAEYFKTKNYSQFKEALDAYRDLGENESLTSVKRTEIKNRIVGFIEDLLL